MGRRERLKLVLGLVEVFVIYIKDVGWGFRYKSFRGVIINWR